jgi:hypothetical protein
MLTTDTLVKADSSNGTAPILVFPAPSGIGERHTVFWFAWDDSQTPPIVEAGGSNKMSPYAGMVMSGTGGLVASTIIPQVGTFGTWVWGGAEWLQVA